MQTSELGPTGGTSNCPKRRGQKWDLELDLGETSRWDLEVGPGGGPGGGTQRWDMEVGPRGGTWRWDLEVGPGGGTRRWDPEVGPGGGNVMSFRYHILRSIDFEFRLGFNM